MNHNNTNLNIDTRYIVNKLRRAQLEGAALDSAQGRGPLTKEEDKRLTRAWIQSLLITLGGAAVFGLLLACTLG